MNEEDNHKNNDGNNGNHNGNGRKITRHHLVPRSRGGRDKKDNIVKIPDRYHESWHRFFGNLTPKEAIHFIKKIFMGRGRRKSKWTMEELYDLQLEIQKQTKVKKG
jgi:hypothetical protein